MTITAPAPLVEASPARAAESRTATRRTYLMCEPAYFDVYHSINPWMDPSQRVDRERAHEQWSQLRDTFERLGHQVHLLEPRAGLPDMVFAANGGFVVGRRALGARFRAEVRAGEAHCHRARLELLGVDVTPAVAFNEGEGDFAWAYGSILAASGFRADVLAADELISTFDVPVFRLQLVDPRFYHLDTALCVLAEDTVAYYPPAFSAASQRWLAERHPDAILADESDALVLGLNAVSDGRHVILPPRAEKLAAAVAERGFVPVPVDLSELLKSGGGAKCCTLELHPWGSSA